MLAAAESESGIRFQVISVPSLETQLEAETLTGLVALRIGAQVCEPHVCRCRANVNTLGLHNLACRVSAAGLPRHAELNDVVKRALHASGVSCLLEPPGLSSDDGRKPNGITMFAYKHGKALCSDSACVYTFVSAHVNESAVRARSAPKNIVREIARRFTEATGDQRETFLFMQRLSLAVQRCNTASIFLR